MRFQLFILDMTLAQYHTYWSISMKKVTQCFFLVSCNLKERY